MTVPKRFVLTDKGRAYNAFMATAGEDLVPLAAFGAGWEAASLRYNGSRGELADRLELLLTRWERDADAVWGGDQAQPIREFVAEFRREVTQ